MMLQFHEKYEDLNREEFCFIEIQDQKGIWI